MVKFTSLKLVFVVVALLIVAAVGYAGLMIWRDRADINIQNSERAVHDEPTGDESTIETPFPGEPDASKFSTSNALKPSKIQTSLLRSVLILSVEPCS